MTANTIGLSQSLVDALREYGRVWAEEEASVWADQHPGRSFPAWTNGTHASIKDAIESQLDAEEIARFRSMRDSANEEIVAAYESLIEDAEVEIDRAAATRWAELADEYAQ